ncbi:hypothetical protein [Pseudomonas soli]|uniref:hypothetical protein n=1 Tax=Pseudomonas soli TaxID=1306993 RepID=UPI00381B1A06
MKIEGYEKRFVAFLDILGFKDLIKKIEVEESDSQDYQRVRVILDFLQSESVESNSHHDLLVYEEAEHGLIERELGDPRINYISDCVIISTEGTFDGFKALCNKVTKFSVQGATVGIYLRGGITYGNIYHHGPMLFGTAYQRALEVEENAVYPRVVVDDVVYDILHEHLGRFPLNEHAIREDQDGKKYLVNFPYGYESGFCTDWLGFLLKAKASILYFLNKFDGRVSGFGSELRRLDNFCCWKEMYAWKLNFDGENQRLLDKYLWLKEEFNSTLCRYSMFLDVSEDSPPSKYGVQEGPRIMPIVWTGAIWAPEKELGRYR